MAVTQVFQLLFEQLLDQGGADRCACDRCLCDVRDRELLMVILGCARPIGLFTGNLWAMPA